MNHFKRHISFFLIIVLSVLIIPKESLHELTDHHDTIDACFNHGENNQIGNNHQHCDVLQLNTPPLFSFFNTFLIHVSSVKFSFNVSNDNFYLANHFNLHYLRGPPTVF